MDNRLKEITEQVEKDIRPIFEKIQINCEKNSKSIDFPCERDYNFSVNKKNKWDTAYEYVTVKRKV